MFQTIASEVTDYNDLKLFLMELLILHGMEPWDDEPAMSMMWGTRKQTRTSEAVRLKLLSADYFHHTNIVVRQLTPKALEVINDDG